MRRPAATPEQKAEKTATELLEESVFLLRSAPLAALACHPLGTLPFVAAALWFWTDMNQGLHAREHLAPGSLLVALLFLWMKTWHALFAARLRDHLLRNSDPAEGGARSFARTFKLQASIQPFGWVILPLAAIAIIPAFGAFAFFQHATAHAPGEKETLRDTIRICRARALRWPRQNQALLILLAIFFVMVEANIATALAIIPAMMKTFLGIETPFSMAGDALINSTFFAVVLALAYAVVDPLIKAVYVLRTYYEESLRTGADIASSWKQASRAAVIVLGLALSLMPASADTATVAPAQLDEAIREVIARPEYAWRLPREPRDTSEERGLLASFLRGIVDMLRDLFRPLKNFFVDVLKWFRDLFKDWMGISPRAPKMPEFSGVAWIVNAALAVVLIVFVTVGLLRWIRHRRSVVKVAATAPTPAAPDLTSDDVSAADLPEENWLALAADLLGRGEFRLALRALYLACLARLAHKELITLKKFKTNRDYQLELARRGRDRPDLLAAFEASVRVFEAAWYGRLVVTEPTVRDYSQQYERIRDHA